MMESLKFFALGLIFCWLTLNCSKVQTSSRSESNSQIGSIDQQSANSEEGEDMISFFLLTTQVDMINAALPANYDGNIYPAVSEYMTYRFPITASQLSETNLLESFSWLTASATSLSAPNASCLVPPGMQEWSKTQHQPGFILCKNPVRDLPASCKISPFCDPADSVCLVGCSAGSEDPFAESVAAASTSLALDAVQICVPPPGYACKAPNNPRPPIRPNPVRPSPTANFPGLCSRNATSNPGASNPAANPVQTITGFPPTRGRIAIGLLDWVQRAPANVSPNPTTGGGACVPNPTPQIPPVRLEELGKGWSNRALAAKNAAASQDVNQNNNQNGEGASGGTTSGGQNSGGNSSPVTGGNTSGGGNSPTAGVSGGNQSNSSSADSTSVTGGPSSGVTGNMTGSSTTPENNSPTNGQSGHHARQDFIGSEPGCELACHSPAPTDTPPPEACTIPIPGGSLMGEMRDGQCVKLGN